MYPAVHMSTESLPNLVRYDISVNVCCIVSYLTVMSLSSCICPHRSLPQEVLGSRCEVMELCGSVGGDMTGCQALMQANIWRLLAMSLLACRQGPLAWGQKPPSGTHTQG